MQKIILEKEAFLNLVYAYNRLVNEISVFIESFGITINQFDILDVIRNTEKGRLKLSELGKKLRKRKPDATRFVDRLEASGLVARIRDTKDRRVCFVYLTKKGSTLLDQIYPLINELHKNHFKHFSKDELEVFNKLLLNRLLLKDKNSTINSSCK